MDKPKNVVFGTALNGYKKQDVNAFIAELNNTFNTAKENYMRENAALRAELTTLREFADQAEKSRSELADLRAALDEARAESAALREELTALKDTEPAVAIEPSVSPEELADLRQKASLYARMSQQLGDMMISANHSAEQLMDETRHSAEQSLSAAKSTIAQSATLLSEQLDALYRSTNRRMVGEINDAMQHSRRSINKFIEELTAYRTRFEESIRQSDLETRRVADEHIARMAECAQDAIDAIGAKTIENGNAE